MSENAVHALDPRVARAEERLAILRELAELGMALARELTRRALETPDNLAASDPDAQTRAVSAPPTAPRRDPADSFARLSRAVRLTLALEAAVEEQLSVLRVGGMDRAAPSPVADDDDDDNHNHYYRALPRDYPSAHRNMIRDAVYEVVNGEITDLPAAEEILDALYERLAEGERYDALVHRPLRAAVQAICDDLGLHPSWKSWAGDDWTPSPPPPGPRYAWELVWVPDPGRQRQRSLQ